MTMEPIKFKPAHELLNHSFYCELDTVKINKLKIDTVIGICEDELVTPQPLVITLEMGIPRPIACESDDIRQTVDYGSVRKTVIDFATNNKYKLLESFTDHLSQILLDKFNLSVIRLEVEKPQKFPDLESVGFVVQRKAQRNPNWIRQRNNIFSLLGSGIVPEK